MMKLEQGQMVRLMRILGMLGSDHAGERAAAGLAAHRILRGMRLTWAQLLAPAAAPNWKPRRGQEVYVFHEPLRAAESRLRQLRNENARLQREVARLRQRIVADQIRAQRLRRGAI